MIAIGAMAGCPSSPGPIGIRIEAGGPVQSTVTTGTPATPGEANPAPERGEKPAPPSGAQGLHDAAPNPRDQAPPPSLTAFTEEIGDTALSFEMLPVPPGAPGPPPPGSFWIARTEMTWDLFDVYLFNLDEAPDHVDLDAIARPSKPYISMDRGFGHAGYPVISPSYHAAQTFCRWLSRKTGRTYRLPTVAEWQYVCTLGGVGPDDLDAHAWTKENSDFSTHATGSKAPDALGVHDLFGNASEWATGRDGTPVTVGGSFRDARGKLACDAVVPESPGWNESDPQIPKSIWWLADGGFVGFRVVCVE